MSVSAEAVDAVFEEGEEELVDAEIEEIELDLDGEEDIASEEPYLTVNPSDFLYVGELDLYYDESVGKLENGGARSHY